MLYSTLVLVARQFFRNIRYSLITLSGLIVGISTAFLIFTWVSYELQYNRQDPNAEKVFLILSHEQVDGAIHTRDETPVPLTDFLLHEVPEVEAMTRIDNTQETLSIENSSITKEGIYADNSFFRVFHTTMLEGLSSDPFPGKNTIALSDELAQTLFPNTSAVGKFVTLANRGEFRVTSVFKKFPQNNSFRYAQFVLPYNTLNRTPDEWLNYYVKLYQAETKNAVEKKIDAKFKEFFGHTNAHSMLFCFTDWRLHWSFENGKVSGGRIVYVVLFGITGIFILLMSCINYMNIATARATRRAREIGVRKMNGATQSVLIKQFLSESLAFSFLATLLSIGVVYMVFPAFREITGVPLQFSLSDPVLVMGLLGIAVFSGIIAGSFPAFMLSSFKPAAVLKGNVYSALTGAGLRRSLVVFQFALSIIMIFGAMIMWQQTNFLLKRDVGYDKHNVINVWLPGDAPLPLQAFKNEVANHPSVETLAYGGASPMEVNGYAEVKWVGMPANHPVHAYGASADYDMIDALKLKLLEGRTFSKGLVSDSSNYVITKSAAVAMGFENPIGQRITYTMFGEREGEIIGVIDDFNNDDIHLPMAPVVFCIGKPHELTNLFVRYKEGQVNAALENLKNVLKKFQPETTLSYSFLDGDYETQLHNELFLGRLSVLFTILAIVIASLGLLGLAMFAGERRTKEIGIRKILGATVAQIITLLFREFVKPLLISFFIAFPIAYYVMNEYLLGFPYKISITAFSFLPVALGMIVLMIIIVSHQSYQAAVKNPVDTLKVE